MFKHGTPQGLMFYHVNGKIPACRKCLQLLDREVFKAIGFQWQGELPNDDEVRKNVSHNRENIQPRKRLDKRHKPQSLPAGADTEKRTYTFTSERSLMAATNGLSRAYLHVKNDVGLEIVKECGRVVQSMLAQVDYVAAHVTFHQRLEPIIDDEFLYPFYDGELGAYLLAAADSLETHDDILSPLSLFMYCGERLNICKMIAEAPNGWESLYDDAALGTVHLQSIIEPTIHWAKE